VTATGADGYTGTVTSSAIGPVDPATPITAIGAVTGETKVGATLTAGLLTPSEATAVYQWQRSSDSGSSYTDIKGATKETYTLSDDDVDCYIRVTATGADGYTGTVTSSAIGPVEPATPITAINVITGEAQVGATLTAGTLTPSEATAVYQWQRSDAEVGDYVDIKGATEETYTLTEDDVDCYIRVTATGADGYMGAVTSSAIGPVVAAFDKTQVESTPAAIDAAVTAETPTETPATPTETPATPTETPATPTETPATPTETPAGDI
jgi:hypothetical protein